MSDSIESPQDSATQIDTIPVVEIQGMPVPNNAEHRLMMDSPEQRALRCAARTGLLAVHGAITNRGRKRPNFEDPDRIVFDETNQLTRTEFTHLANAVARKSPIFDKFTKGYHVDPTESAITAYCSVRLIKPIQNRKSSKQAKLDETEEQGRNELIDPRTPAQLIQASKRQSQHIADMLQQSVFDNRNVALQRGISLRTIQQLLVKKREIDPVAAVYAADAIADFGYTLLDHPDIGRAAHEEDIAYRIARIGLVALKDPDVFRRNTSLVELVRREQGNRFAAWDTIYAATARFLGDRLLVVDKANGAALDTEIARQTAILEAAS
jgi:hypothetical protein